MEPSVLFRRHRQLLFTAISLAVVFAAAFAIRGLHRFLPKPDQGQQQESEGIQIESADPGTAKQILSGEIPAATTQPR